MGRKFTNEDLDAWFEIPDPVTAEDAALYWDAYWAEMGKPGTNQANAGAVMRANCAAYQALLQSGQYELQETVYDLKSMGLNAPLRVVQWVNITIRRYLEAEMTVPLPEPGGGAGRAGAGPRSTRRPGRQLDTTVGADGSVRDEEHPAEDAAKDDDSQ